MHWFIFKVGAGDRIVEVKYTGSNGGFRKINVGYVDNFVCALDELDAFIVAAKWLRLGCPWDDIHVDRRGYRLRWCPDREGLEDE